MRQATLCLLVKEKREDKEVLLAIKKRGFGVGKWNGIGGKLDPQKGDQSISEAAIREAEEEVGIKIKQLEKVGILSFYFPYIDNQAWDQEVHVFLVRNWEGEPRESEEMVPKWFKATEIPFQEMWDDDRFWLPKILEGRKLKAKFVFEEGEKVVEKSIDFVEHL